MELTDPLSELYGLPPGAAVLLPQRTEMRMAFVLVACHWRVPFAQRWYDRTYRLPRWASCGCGCGRSAAMAASRKPDQPPVCGFTLDGIRCRKRGDHRCLGRVRHVLAFFTELLYHTKGEYARKRFVPAQWQAWTCWPR